MKKYLNIPFGMLTPGIIIPCFDFINMRPKVFDNLGGDNDVMSYEIACATSAAPTYFDPYNCKDTAYIDGGLLENIPLMTAMTCISSKTSVRFSDMDIFVIGTGQCARREYSPKQMKGWGAPSWAKPLVDMLTGANEISSVYWANQCAPYNITVYNPIQLKPKWKMDDPSIIKELCVEADKHSEDFAYKYKKWLSA
jgi:patatin-like phospholipase/acyl hydrolase